MASRETRRALKKIDKTKGKPQATEKEGKKKPLLWIFSVALLAVIVITFVGGPIAGRLGQSGRIIFGTYKGKEIQFIPGNYFSRQSEMIAEQIRANSQDQQNIQYQAYQVWRTAFERTVLHTAILLETEKSGMIISDDKINTELVRTGPYIVNGEFSEEAYQATSATEKSRNRDLFEENLLHQQYLLDTMQDKKESSKEIEFIKQMAETERSFKYVEFTFDDFPEERIIAFGRENADLFREVKLSRITINSDRKDAESIYGQLVNNPGMFEELARTQSKDGFADKGGDMGWRSYYSLEPDFERAEDLDSVFSMEKDEISEVIETSFGWVIYRMDESPREINLEDPDALERVSSYIQIYEGGMIEDYLLEEAESFINATDEKEFESAALDFNKFHSVTDFAPINYGNNFFLKPLRTVGEDKSALMQRLSTSEDFFREGFSLEENGISNPIIVDDMVIVLQLIGERSADQEDLDNLDFYYPYVLQQFKEEEMNNFFLDSDDLVDNFDDVFYEYFLPR